MYKTFFLDVDGTLTFEDPNAWDVITIQLGADINVHMDILRKMAAKQITLEESIQELVDLWASTGKATVKEITRVLSENVKLRPGAGDFIKYLQDSGKGVVLLTNSIDLNVKNIVDKFGITEFFTSTQLIFDDKGVIQTFTYPEDLAEYKRQIFMQYIKTHDLTAAECAMIGNGTNDLSVIKLCGFSACPVGSDQEILGDIDYIFEDFVDLQKLVSIS